MGLNPLPFTKCAVTNNPAEQWRLVVIEDYVNDFMFLITSR